MCGCICEMMHMHMRKSHEYKACMDVYTYHISQDNRSYIFHMGVEEPDWMQQASAISLDCAELY